MHTRLRIIFSAFTVTLFLALALASTSASAGRFSVSEREFRVLLRSVEFEAAGNTIRCPTTLSGHFLERTIPKIANSRVGVITRAEPVNSAEPPCTGGTATVLSETLPWTFNYSSFTGTLPAIQRMRLVIIGFFLRIIIRGSGLSCLFGTTAREPAAGELVIGAGGRIESLRADETTSIRLGGGFLCELAGSARYAGTGTVLNLPGTASATVTLI